MVWERGERQEWIGQDARGPDGFGRKGNVRRAVIGEDGVEWFGRQLLENLNA